MSEANKAYKVKVGERVPKGRHNTAYWVTWPTNEQAKAALGSITVEASRDAWEGKSPPNIGSGDYLVVRVKGKPAGWRAVSARFFQPEDRDNPDIVQ